MIPYLLLQIVVVPVIASLAMIFIRPGKNRQSAWIAIVSLAYTSFLLALAGIRIYAGEIIFEQYPIGPDVSFNLMADGKPGH